ncbi:4a-hydroxytetrahydrobiopterin dehydratase [Paludisphaera sp.]|uniref:4a-hydroxytetrahydrobiopterin dehydratase n=1 Tax=Paludisphaera sp. TaxID=2017432 RepID=UPI00301DB757
MSTASAAELTSRKCVPCEGGIPPLSREEIDDMLKAVPEWSLSGDGARIRREWTVKNFMAGLRFFEKVGEVAESEGHHPDLHLTGYRHVAVELFTHAVGGLTENDFILAAKIDALPIETKKKA